MPEELMPRYQQEYRRMHLNPKRFQGLSIKRHVQNIKDLVVMHGAETLLDYGCGKGHQYLKLRVHEQWGNILPHCYDPGIKAFSNLPDGPFDGVICTDVAEHVPEEEIRQVIEEILDRALRFAYISVALEPSRKTFEDGSNLHVLLKPRAWWMDLLGRLIADRRTPEAVWVVFHSHGEMETERIR